PEQPVGARLSRDGFLRRIPWRTRRIRLVIAAVAASVLVLVSAALLPSLEPRAAQSDADRPQQELEATLVLAPDFQPAIPDVYLVPASTSSAPHLTQHFAAPPEFMRAGTDNYVRWHQRHDGVPLGQQTVRVVLTGASTAPVVITRISPFVVSRQPP